MQRRPCLAPTRRASFQESNSLLQAKSFWGFFRPVSSNLSCQVMCIHSNQRIRAVLQVEFWASYLRSTWSPRTRSHVALVVYFFLLSTPMSANEQLFLLIFFRARCNDWLAAQIFCREFKWTLTLALKAFSPFSLLAQTFFFSNQKRNAAAFSTLERKQAWVLNSIWSFVTGFLSFASLDFSDYKGND